MRLVRCWLELYQCVLSNNLHALLAGLHAWLKHDINLHNVHQQRLRNVRAQSIQYDRRKMHALRLQRLLQRNERRFSAVRVFARKLLATLERNGGRLRGLHEHNGLVPCGGHLLPVGLHTDNKPRVLALPGQHLHARRGQLQLVPRMPVHGALRQCNLDRPVAVRLCCRLHLECHLAYVRAGRTLRRGLKLLRNGLRGAHVCCLFELRRGHLLGLGVLSDSQHGLHELYCAQHLLEDRQCNHMRALQHVPSRHAPRVKLRRYCEHGLRHVQCGNVLDNQQLGHVLLVPGQHVPSIHKSDIS